MLRACTRSNSFAVDMTKWVPAIVINGCKSTTFSRPNQTNKREMYETCEKMYQMSNGASENYNPPDKSDDLAKAKNMSFTRPIS